MRGHGCSAAASTDPGQRPYNEDRYLVDLDGSLYVVADGVGGREAGEVASRLACETIAQRFDENASLRESIEAAHIAVRKAVEERREAIDAQRPDPDAAQAAAAETVKAAVKSSGMASTVVALHIAENDFHIAWAGDSRAYLWDGEELAGLSRDHSLVEQLVARGEISRSEARTHPQKNVIRSGVGGDSDNIQISSNMGDRSRGGIFLLCSDGLSDVLPHAVICSILSKPTTLQERATELTDAARDAGGHDNITVVLVECPPVAALSSADSNVPDIFERYQAATDSLSWPVDERPVELTVQRVRARASTGTESYPSQLPGPLPQLLEEALEEQRRSVPRQVVLLGIGAAVLVALLFLALELQP